jgi:ariadne-1
MSEEEKIEGFGEYEAVEEDYSQPAVTYRLCNIKDAEQKMKEKIDSVISFLSISTDEVLLLLQHFKWNESKLLEAWTDDTAIKSLREKIGIPLKPFYKFETDCPICGDKINPKVNGVALSCGHSACISCVSGFVVASLKSNEVVFTCWECKCKIPYSIIEKVLNPKDFGKFKSTLIRSYTNESKTIKWCPSRGCEYYCDFPDMLTMDIKCYCGCIYCYGCNQESHKPAKCENRKKWDAQNSNEDEKLLASFAKKCPKCGVYIDKNGGCFQMTCYKCHHQFCWMCLADWSTHSDHFSCLKFPKLKVDNVNADQIKKAEEQLKSF